MSVVENERSEVAKLAAKLDQARRDLRVVTDEANDLRNRVVELESKSPVEELQAKVEDLGRQLATSEAALRDANAGLEKAKRDLAAAGPALDLAAAIKAL